MSEGPEPLVRVAPDRESEGPRVVSRPRALRKVLAKSPDRESEDANIYD